MYEIKIDETKERTKKKNPLKNCSGEYKMRQGLFFLEVKERLEPS